MHCAHSRRPGFLFLRRVLCGFPLGQDELGREAQDVSQRAVVARMGALLGPSLGGSGPRDTRARRSQTMAPGAPSAAKAAAVARTASGGNATAKRSHSTYKRIMERIAEATGLHNMEQARATNPTPGHPVRFSCPLQC